MGIPINKKHILKRKYDTLRTMCKDWYFIVHRHNCPIVNRACKYCCYNEDFDVLYCELKNEWLEPICEDKKCSICWKRPTKPLNK